VRDTASGWGYTWTSFHLQWMGVVGGAAKRARIVASASGVRCGGSCTRLVRGMPVAGAPALDLIVTLDYRTGEIYRRYGRRRKARPRLSGR